MYIDASAVSEYNAKHCFDMNVGNAFGASGKADVTTYLHDEKVEKCVQDDVVDSMSSTRRAPQHSAKANGKFMFDFLHDVLHNAPLIELARRLGYI